MSLDTGHADGTGFTQIEDIIYILYHILEFTQKLKVTQSSYFFICVNP